nr:MAG TPA: endonuclease [Caudoviricetes sp.]
MVTLNDVNNELHVRLYVLEMFKDYVRDDDFDELLDKALDFVMEGVSMPKAPAKDTTMSDISKSVLALVAGAGIEGMKRLWGKKVSDLSHSSFINKLTYIASKYGVIVHKIDKWYPSSKTCECGFVNKNLSLRDRTWCCPKCESINDRDVLAARNILRKGISELESKSNSSDSNIGVSCVCIQESHLL